LLLPYTKSPYLFRCPSSTGTNLNRHLGYARSLKAYKAGGRDVLWTHHIGYGFNEALVANPCRPRTLSSLKSGPCEVALFSDAEQPWASSDGHWVMVNGEWERFWDWDPHARLWHGEGQNFVYADGRAGWRRPVVEGEEGKEVRGGYFPDAKLE
jgi:hypothetical protein